LKTKVQKWGNSLALRIPKSYAWEAGLEDKSAVDISVVDGKLVVARVNKPLLEELLGKITLHNLHREVSTGPTAGCEIW